MNLIIKEIEPGNISQEWNDFVLTHPLPNYSIGHNPSLPVIFNKLFKYKPVYCKIYDGQKMIGVFQAVKDKDKIISLPFFTTSGLCIDPQYSSNEIYEKIAEHFNCPYEIRDFVKFSEFVFDKKVTSYLDLKNSEEEQLKSYDKRVRVQIKKGYSNGLQIQVGGVELLPVFYDIYIRNMHRLGTPHPSINFFKTFMENYKNGLCKIFVATYESKPIGCSMTITYGKMAEMVWGSTIREYNHLKPNMFVYWEVMRYAIEQKMEILSFGRSDAEGNHISFKKQWGVKIYPIYFNYSSQVSNVRDYQLIRKIWSTIPFPVVKVLGPIIRKRVTT